MVAYFRANTGILHWSGTVGIGVFACGREYYDEPAVAIMLCAFDVGSFRVFSGLRSPPDLERQSLHLGGLPANFAIVHGDPRNAQLPRLIGDLAGCMESGFVAGGLTSSRREVVQIADGLARGGLSGVLFSDDVVVSTRLTQGCAPIGDVPKPGAQIMFCRRDEPSATEDMSRMLDSIKSGLFGRPRGGLYYSCVGRGPNLFSEESGEANMIREALGEFPLVGFFCNGEISHNRLYGYTGILTLFL